MGSRMRATFAVVLRKTSVLRLFTRRRVVRECGTLALTQHSHRTGGSESYANSGASRRTQVLGVQAFPLPPCVTARLNSALGEAFVSRRDCDRKSRVHIA